MLPRNLHTMTLLLLGVAGLCSGCGREAEASSTLSAGVVAVAEGAALGDGPVLAPPYPRGRWRLASSEELSRVMLWVSHILVRHQGVDAGRISFELPYWTSAPPPPPRTRRAAYELADALQRAAQGNPEKFAALARERSEDVATQSAGGSLGGIRATRLFMYPNVLDAMAALPAGGVSRVVETQFGFHIFLRRSPPPEQLVSGSRIIIGHDDAPWLNENLARHAVPKRSRRDALSLANVVYEKARSNPGAFASLVDKYSEHRDVLREGDFGAWSTHEPTPFPRQLEVLLGLEMGAVAPPLDSLFGYEIIQRTPERARQRFAMSWVEVAFEPRVPPEHARSRTRAHEIVSSVVATVRAEPARFKKFQAQYCCAVAKAWYEGQGDAPVERALARLGMGDIADEPVELAKSYLVVRRLDPGALPAQPVTFELPAPAHPDIEHLVAHRGALENISLVAQRATRELELGPELTGQLAAYHEVARRSGAAPSLAGRLAAYHKLQRQVGEVLGPKRHARYMRSLYAYFEERLLAQSE